MTTKIVSWEEWASWVNKQLEGHQSKLERLVLRLEQLELDFRNKVEPMYTKHMEPKILELLRNEKKLRTLTWIQNRLGLDAREALRELEREGLVVVTRSGPHTLYSIKEEEPRAKSLGDLEPLSKIVAGEG